MMSEDLRLVIFAGRVRARDGAGVGGTNVEIVDRETDSVLGSGLTAADGGYRVAVATRRGDLEGRRPWSVRATDATGEVLAERGAAEESMGAVVTDLQVPRARLKRFEAVALPHEQVHGPIVDPQALQTIDAAIGGFAGPGNRRHDRYRNAARCAVPPIARFESLLADAWGVLQGRPGAGHTLRRDLNLLAQLPRERDLPSLQPRLPREALPFQSLAALAMGGHPLLGSLPSRHSCAVPTGRLLPVIAAALRVARDAEDARRLLAGVEGGMCGTRLFEALLGLATESLGSGDFSRLRAELDMIAAACGVDDRPVPEAPGMPWPPECPPPVEVDVPEVCETELFLCSMELTKELARLHLQFSIPRYWVNSVTPSTACPGDTVVLQGSGFGTVPGQICFPHRAGGQNGCVDPVPGTWTDTRIEAVAPDEAGSGLVSLRILDGVPRSCNGYLELYAQGVGAPFAGGAPCVSSLTLDGRTSGIVAPGARFTVAWTASPAGNTAIRLRVKDAASSLSFDQPGLPAAGSVSLTAPSLPYPNALFVNAVATNACGADAREIRLSIEVLPRLMIDGIEVTQGIQTFWRTGVAANSLATIATKDTIVRVYVSSDRGGFNGDLTPDVTGALEVVGLLPVLTPINGTSPSQTRGNPFITARPRGAITRGNTDHTLNFRIPASLANGTQTLKAHVVWRGPSGATTVATQTISWTWETKRALPVRFVLVGDNRPATTGTGTVPTEDDGLPPGGRTLGLCGHRGR
jgi:hypothetical protein